MPTIPLDQATRQLADEVARMTDPDDLREIHVELFPGRPRPVDVDAEGLARHVQNNLAPEDISGLWSIIYPRDRRVCYDVESDGIQYNEEVVEFVD